MNKNTKSITFQRAAAELCVSDSTILRLVQRGTLHTTKPELVDGHWTRRIVWDKSFQAERARRLNGIKAPRRKTIPNPNLNLNLNPSLDPSPIQTVTQKQKSELTQSAMLERAENAMGICIDARKDCQDIKDSITIYQHEVDTWAMEKVRTIQASELTCARCTAILATACILQLLLAAYYTLCHFNII